MIGYNELIKLLEELHLDDDIELSDIPNLDLYMDQVITLFNTNLDHLKRNEEDKILTKTMINNYSKSKILVPPNKKKYTKNHIILLILIYYLKQSLSINDIRLLFKNIDVIFQSKNEDGSEIEKLYESFLNIKKAQIDNISAYLEKEIDLVIDKSKELNPDTKEMEINLITVLALINEANTLRRLAEKIIDNYFRDKELN